MTQILKLQLDFQKRWSDLIKFKKEGTIGEQVANATESIQTLSNNSTQNYCVLFVP